ncbi:hypothetical protein ACH5RR_025822 [Cinchona calisaya]|uniref:Uncharacterized protein n=1 Tax=Cinchona calisaya TaxID=153742 RepID=A0ABD2Z442_9GENT
MEKIPSKRQNADQTCAFHSNISRHAIDNFHALHHEIQDLIDKVEFIPLMDVEQAYDPSINTISVEESLDDTSKLIILESEMIEKFSQMHLRLKGKTTISEESKLV